MYADLFLTHPLIRKVNGVFSLLGESKKGDQQGDVALTDNNITGQNHTQVYDRLHAESILFETILMVTVVACQVNTANMGRQEIDGCYFVKIYANACD